MNEIEIKEAVKAFSFGFSAERVAETRKSLSKSQRGVDRFGTTCVSAVESVVQGMSFGELVRNE